MKFISLGFSGNDRNDLSGSYAKGHWRVPVCVCVYVCAFVQELAYSQPKGVGWRGVGV